MVVCDGQRRAGTAGCDGQVGTGRWAAHDRRQDGRVVSIFRTPQACAGHLERLRRRRTRVTTASVIRSSKQARSRARRSPDGNPAPSSPCPPMLGVRRMRLLRTMAEKPRQMHPLVARHDFPPVQPVMVQTPSQIGYRLVTAARPRHYAAGQAHRVVRPRPSAAQCTLEVPRLPRLPSRCATSPPPASSRRRS